MLRGAAVTLLRRAATSSSSLSTGRAAGVVAARRSYATDEVIPKKEHSLPLPLRLFGLEGRYATALYYAAGDKNNLNAVESDLLSLAELAKSNETFRDFLKDPSVPKQDKAKAIVKLLDSLKLNPVTVQFFGTLAEHGRLPQTLKVIEAFEDILRAYRGEVKAVVTSADPLTDQELNEVKSALGDYVEKGQTIKLQTKVNREIIGGLVVDVGDKHIDLSLATRVRVLEQSLREAF
eukprot:jgi/Chlat1/1075/Chrsp110S01569